MSAWKSLCAIALILACPPSARAMDLVREFANCTGRYSALMEHQWLMHVPGSEATQARRNMFADLLDAVRGAEDGHQVLAWRIEAKAAQAALFHTRDFGTDPALRARAATRAETHIAACDTLILGS